MSQSRESAPPPLHELEGAVMDEVWRRDTATVRNVLEALNSSGKRRAYTTIMTIMRRLDRKGLLRRERHGRTDVYSPVLSRSAYIRARAGAEVEALVQEYGDVALAQFARAIEQLGPQRVAEIRTLAEDRPGTRR